MIKIDQNTITHWLNNYYPPLDFRGANLIGLDLCRGNFLNADLTGAFLDRTDLHAADLSGCILTNVSLRNAEYDDDTKWPDGFNPRAAGAVRAPRYKKLGGWWDTKQYQDE